MAHAVRRPFPPLTVEEVEARVPAQQAQAREQLQHGRARQAAVQQGLVRLRQGGAVRRPEVSVGWLR